MSQSTAPADLKDAKQVMEDEGGANQASQKKQQVKQAESNQKSDDEDTCGCGPAPSKPSDK